MTDNKRNSKRNKNASNKGNNKIKVNNQPKPENKIDLEDINTGINDIEIFDDGKYDVSDLKEIKEIDISKHIDKRDKDVVGNCRRVLKNKHKEEPETTIKADMQQNMVLWIVLAVLTIILVIALIITNVGDDKEKNDDDKQTKDIETTTVEETTTQSKELVPEEKDSPITQLIKNYLKAERIDVSMDEVSKYVDNSEKISLEKYDILKKYIEEFQNITCYKLNSIDEKTYIVLATYGCKFYNIETAAPGCETFLVVNKDGQYLVHNFTVQESIDTYISSDVDVTLINQINKEINDSLKAAIESDEELAKVIDVLSESGSEGESE